MKSAVNAGWDASTYDAKFKFVTDAGGAILDRLGVRPGERVLDLGCGTGELTAEIAARGATVVGLDGDAAMIERARARFPKLSFVEGNAEDVAWTGSVGTFDAVFSNAALHWMQPEPTLANVRLVLRPGGRFVGEFGGRGNVASVLSALAAAADELGLPPRRSPWFFPSIARYAAALEAAGFEPRFMSLFDRPTPVPHLERGLGDWLRMFGKGLFADLSRDQIVALESATIEHARTALERDEGWVIDYRRLRFEAVVPL